LAAELKPGFVRIIALATCHNRRDHTLTALQSISQQTLPGNCKLEICLVDDGSSDGTGDAVREIFPDVKLLEGTGNLYWAGGMRAGWERYVKHEKFDYLLVFNDDIELFTDAIAILVSTAQRIQKEGSSAFAVVAAFQEPLSDQVTYGGLVLEKGWKPLQFKILVPSTEYQDCDTLNMNLALISNAALAQTNFLSKQFTHAKADFDFGLRLRKLGGRIILAPGYAGKCPVNSEHGTSTEANLGFAERWRRITGIKEEPPGDRAVFCRRHAGFFWPVIWIVPYARICIGSMISQLKRFTSNDSYPGQR
jgi:GT2 family glycosyltransferase